MRVARANRQLAEDLPDVVLNRTGRISRSDRVWSDYVEPALRAQSSRTKSAALDRREPQGLPFSPLQTCKARPESSRGQGGSRPFVPWCRK